jgi:hypothetical protein
MRPPRPEKGWLIGTSDRLDDVGFHATHHRGDFTCYFRHDFPASEHKTGHGQAVFIAAPALNPGWYVYQFQSCD